MRISDWSSDVCSSDLAVVGEIADISIEIEGDVWRREARDAETRQRGQQGVAVARVGRNADGHLVVGLKGCDGGDRSEESRVGQERVSTCRTRTSPTLSNKKHTRTINTLHNTSD